MPEDKDEIKIPKVSVDVPDYPNWKRGIIAGLLCAIPVFGLSWLIPKADLGLAGTLAIIAYLAVGGLVAFRPLR